MIYHFGACVLDAERYELQRAGEVVAIEPKVFQVLVYLIRHRDRVVTRDELLEYCWPGTFVSEAALTQCLARARKAVGDHRGGPPLIKTVHGQGYRFVAPLLTDPGAGAPPAAGDGPGVFALCGVWYLATGLGAGYAGPGRGGSGADAPGPGGHPGYGADAGAATRSGLARGGRRAHGPGSG